jgi:hypothetical protein
MRGITCHFDGCLLLIGQVALDLAPPLPEEGKVSRF